MILLQPQINYIQLTFKSLFPFATRKMMKFLVMKIALKMKMTMPTTKPQESTHMPIEIHGN